MNVDFVLNPKNNVIDIATRSMNKGSVNPNEEFCIMCGSNVNNATPKIE